MNLEMVYTPARDVVNEVIDGEAVIINLTTGVYYSLIGVGGRIWDRLAKGHSPLQILDFILSEYQVDRNSARVDLESLLEELVNEHLMQPACTPTSPQPEAPVNGSRSYLQPRLEIYRDMGDLLALDPPAPGLSDIAWQAESAKRQE